MVNTDALSLQLILELCQFEATVDSGLIQPHLDRVQTLIEAWVTEVGAGNEETPHSEFVTLVKTLLKNPDERKHFFQHVFPEEFGPTYDEALHTLMWMFLSRLENLSPLPNFQQVASMFGEVSSSLEECLDSVCRHEELKTLLRYQKDLSQLDHNDNSMEGASIISALKLPPLQLTEADQTKPQTNILNDMQTYTSDLIKNESLTLTRAATTEDHTSQPKAISLTHGENATAVILGDKTRHEDNLGPLQNQVKPEFRRLKRCCVRVNRLDVPVSLQSRPVRRNRGRRMNRILVEEKRGLHEDSFPAGKYCSRGKKLTKSVLSEISDHVDPSNFVKHSYMAPIDNCSEGDSWSDNSDEDFCPKTSIGCNSVADSLFSHSDDECSSVTPVRRPTDNDLLCKNESVGSKKEGTSDIKASAPKKTRQVQCFICKEHVNTSLRAHMSSHFPTGDYACPRCDSRFKLFSSLRLHLNRTCFEYNRQQKDQEKLDENLYKCDKCEEAFRYKVSLQRHILTHNELYCTVCRKVLRDAATLARHKASHTLFQCNRCEETFTLFKPLLRHCQNIHKIVRPFKCNHCPKTLPKLRILIAHEWKHTGHLPFRCAKCGLRFKTDADLISHERVHTREKPYLCAECGKTFSQNSNLLRHLNLIHSEARDKKRHSCSECEKSFKEKGALIKHQRSKHLNELFRHPCPYCGKMLSASTIARHKLIHTGERPFKCTVPECDKLFRSATEVTRHVLIHHTADRPYKCDVCGKGFIKMGFLNTHAKTHSGEKPFACHICGKAFPKRYSMQRHKKLVHTFVTE